MYNYKKLNILIHNLGSVEYGIIRKIRESELINNIYIISNNKLNDIDCIFVKNPKKITFGELKKFITEKNIDFCIIFNEMYSFSGMVDYYQKNIKIPVIGINKEWYMLEFSKLYGKKFFQANNINTPDFMIIDKSNKIDEAISLFGLPIVIKNNFLQAGFGSYIYNNKKSALNKAKKLIGKYNFCIAEKYLYGKELSLQYMWDKETLLPLLPVKDIKKNENGINTGGLGCYTPVVISENEQKLLNEYNKKIEDVFKMKTPNFTGIFTSNIMFANNKIYTLEFNMRPGINEFETLIEHLDCDLLEILYNCAIGNLKNTKIRYKTGITGCVALAHKDYCIQKDNTCSISLSKKILPIDNDIKINFNIHASDKNNKFIISKNKRFLSVLYTDKINPFPKIYKYINSINLKNIYYRKDLDTKYEKQII